MSDVYDHAGNRVASVADYGHAAAGVDLEIFSRQHGDENPVAVVPSGVRINGQEVLLPEGASIHIDEISNRNVVTATVTMFVRSLTIRHEAS